MSKSNSVTSELVAAAVAFDEELARFSQASDTACGRPLDTNKNLRIVAESLQVAADSEEQLGLRAQELLAALTAARDSQQAQSNAVRARIGQFQDRVQAHGRLLEQLRTLGSEANCLTEVAKRLTMETRQGAEALRGRADFQAALLDLDGRVAEAAKEAQTIVVDAKAADFDEVASEAHAFGQTLTAVRNKVNLVRQTLSSPLA